jgi:hypothetical protein
VAEAVAGMAWRSQDAEVVALNPSELKCRIGTRGSPSGLAEKRRDSRLCDELVRDFGSRLSLKRATPSTFNLLLGDRVTLPHIGWFRLLGTTRRKLSLMVGKVG